MRKTGRFEKRWDSWRDEGQKSWGRWSDDTESDGGSRGSWRGSSDDASSKGRGCGASRESAAKKPDAGTDEDRKPASGSPVDIDDVIVGTDADENLQGYSGDDVLIGARGNDKLFGGFGEDYLSGNQGADTLFGGKGADIFVFDGDFDNDLVSDFSIRDGDRIEFVFYDSSQAGWTSDTMLEMCEQVGRHAQIELVGTDEAVVLKNTDVESLTAEMITVIFYDEALV